MIKLVVGLVVVAGFVGLLFALSRLGSGAEEEKPRRAPGRKHAGAKGKRGSGVDGGDWGYWDSGSSGSSSSD